MQPDGPSPMSTRTGLHVDYPGVRRLRPTFSASEPLSDSEQRAAQDRPVTRATEPLRDVRLIGPRLGPFKAEGRIR